MNNPESIVNHSLNLSSTKQTYSFPRSSRFAVKNSQNGQVMYTLPSTLNKRTCSFGSGTKIDLTLKSSSPPPGTYQSVGDLSNSKRLNTISFSPGRDKVKFGSFLLQAEKKKNLPSPNRYKLKNNNYSSKYGRMAAKLPTDFDILMRKKTPGPGEYSLAATEMKKTGQYKLATLKNPLVPKYHSPSLNRQNSLRQKRCTTIGPGQYDNQNSFDKPVLSKFRNSIKQTFTKSVRQGLQDKTKKNLPGFKYRMFSQFSGTQN